MTTAQIESRQERAHKGVLIASRVDGGFRVYSTDNPSQQYSVTWNGERLTCTCPDFEFHQADPGWRCKHIMAVEPFDNNLPELPEPAEDAGEQRRYADQPLPKPRHSGEPPRERPPRKRRAPKEPPSPTHMVIKRSVSPDGRIDSVSVEFSTPVLDLQVGEIKERALKTLQLQREIVSSFLKLNGQCCTTSTSRTGATRAHRTEWQWTSRPRQNARCRQGERQVGRPALHRLRHERQPHAPLRVTETACRAYRSQRAIAFGPTKSPPDYASTCPARL